MQDCKTSVSQGVTKAVSESKNLETGMWEENKPDLQGRTVLRGLMPSLDYTPVKIVVYFRDCDCQPPHKQCQRCHAPHSALVVLSVGVQLATVSSSCGQS